MDAPTSIANESTPASSPGDAAINWAPAAGPVWPSTDDALDAALALLPTVDDDVTSAVVEALTVALVELHERVDATRTAYTTALALLHNEQREVRRLRNRLAEVLDGQRQVRL